MNPNRERPGLAHEPPAPAGGDRIRLLLAISDFSGGGAERQLSILLRHLSRERFEPHICVWRPVFQYEPPRDVPLHLVPKTRPWHVASATLGMRRLIDDLEPDLIYSQLHYVNMVTGTALALARHRPRWICRQANDPRREMRGPFAVWARRALRRADQVVGCSRGVTRATVEHLHLDPAHVATVDNLADVAAIEALAQAPLSLPRSPQTFVVAHVGRFHPQKNHALLLRAFSRLRGRDAELWLLGEGEERARLEALSVALGLADQVRWVGFQSNPFPFLRAADCLALSSDYEGLPNAVIEAMLCGTAVVATRCPYGPDELIDDGITGLLVPVGGVAAFGDALVRLADDRATAARMGAAARSVAAVRFDTARGCQAFESLFTRVVHDGPAPSRR